MSTCNRMSLRNNRLKFMTAGKLPVILEGSIEYTHFNKGKPEDVEHVTGWNCKH